MQRVHGRLDAKRLGILGTIRLPLGTGTLAVDASQAFVARAIAGPTMGIINIRIDTIPAAAIQQRFLADAVRLQADSASVAP